jgi:hypothetical protein
MSKANNTIVKIPISIIELLWEYKAKPNQLNEFSGVIIERVLQFGNSRQIKWLFKNVGYQKIINYFAKRGWQLLSNKSYNYWFLFLKNFKKNNIDWQLINKQRFLLKQRNKFWNY